MTRALSWRGTAFAWALRHWPARGVLVGLLWSAGACAVDGPAADLFPSQSWASLSLALRAAPGGDAASGEQGDAPSNAAGVVQEDAAPSDAAAGFQVAGLWREAGKQIVVLQRGDRAYVLCRGCGLAAAIEPGAELEQGYRLGALAADSVVLRDAQGRPVRLQLDALPIDSGR